MSHLKNLAWHESLRRHNENADADGYGCRNGHEGKHGRCSHLDCSMVRLAEMAPPAARVERATPEPAAAVFHQHYFVCPRCGQQWFTLERDPACEHADCRAEIVRLTAEIARLRAALGSRGAHEEPLKDVLGEMSMKAFQAAHANDTPVHPHDIVRFSQMDMDAVTKPLHVEIERLEAALRGLGTPQAKEDDQCGAPENPRGWSYECTLKKGHDGPHIAHGGNQIELHRWAALPPSPAEKEPT